MNNSDKKKQELKYEYDAFIETVKKIHIKSFYEEGMLGSISELYDSKAPFLPKGARAQAWSVAEVFRIILENI